MCFALPPPPPLLRTPSDTRLEEVMMESPQNMLSGPPHTKVLIFKALHRKCQILISSLTWGEDQGSFESQDSSKESEH